MTKYISRITIAFFVLSLISCQERDGLVAKMEHIKAVGDNNPILALSMLDSLQLDIRNSDEHTRMTYDMLSLRLNDKADHMPVSDILSRRVVAYFEKNGSDVERQEAYYYAGSVYRDLQDSPRAIEFFLKSLEEAEISGNRDSMLMRNAYSNLHSLFYYVQDYHSALLYAQKEYKMSERLDNVDPLQMLHIAVSYAFLDSIPQAKDWLERTFSHASSSTDRDCDILFPLLFHFSHLNDTVNAYACARLMEDIPRSQFDETAWLALAEYYRLEGKVDSAIVCYQQIVENSRDYASIYDASKFLYRICEGKGDTPKALKYARLFVDACDSLDLGRRQELAATVNNQFRYHLDKSKEERMWAESQKYRFRFLMVCALSALFFSLCVLFFVYRRNRFLKKEMNLSRQIDEMNARLSDSDNELKNKERQLSERVEQNKTILRMLHRSDFETKAEDVVEMLTLSAKGKRKMTAEDWGLLYQTVDKLYPECKEHVVTELGIASEQQLRAFYLLYIGFSKADVMKLTDTSRTTLWRWMKLFKRPEKSNAPHDQKK